MNRKIIGSLALIAILAAAIILSRVGRDKGSVTVPEVRETADRIVLATQSETVTLKKKGTAWVIEPAGWPADPAAVNAMTDRLKKIGTLELISDKGYLENYGLDPARRISASLFSGDKKLMEITLGNAGPSMAHTFVGYKNGNDVYLASGNLREILNPSLDRLRDKTIAEVKAESATSLTISGKTGNFTFVKEIEAVSPDKKSQPEKSRERWICRGHEAVELEGGMVISAIRSLEPLRAASFPPDTTDPGPESVRVNVKAGESNHELFLYGKDAKGGRYARFTGYPWLFTLEAHVAEKFYIAGPEAFRVPAR